MNSISRRPLLLALAVAVVATIADPAPVAAAEEDATADVLVYGATPAGIAAALAAGGAGCDVLLVSPHRRVGGMVTNGLSHSDFRTFEGLTGAFLRFTRRVAAHYANAYGEGSPQARGHFRGTHGEPGVNLEVFLAMLADEKNVRLVTGRWLERAETDPGSGRVLRVVFAPPENGPAVGGGPKKQTTAEAAAGAGTLTVEAGIVIDATYEGDLMAAAGVPYRVGREARATYGESLAPEVADGRVQGYNFRLVATRNPANRLLPAEPPGYDRELFAGVLPILASGWVKTVFCRQTGGLYKAHRPSLPNGKYDVNDVSRGAVRLSLPDLNDGWPDADRAERERLFQLHQLHNVGLLYFLQNDPAVPENVRAEAREWGWCRDEFTATGGLPEQLYVREARRMVGLRVFTQVDTDAAPGDARAVHQPDAIAMGDYGPNCHGTGREGPRYGGRHTGEFYHRVPPYPIPYGTIVPRRCPNLLVPVACSASHVGFCALRLEPIWMALGEAAGTAAALARESDVPVQRVPVAEFQRRLHAAGAATTYVSDVLPGHPDFAAVQFWASRGGLHGLAPAPAEPGQRGAHLLGQYFEAFPGHAAELDRAIDADPGLRERWTALAREIGAGGAAVEEAETRGDLIRAVFAAVGGGPAED